MSQRDSREWARVNCPRSEPPEQLSNKAPCDVPVHIPYQSRVFHNGLQTSPQLTPQQTREREILCVCVSPPRPTGEITDVWRVMRERTSLER